MNRSQQAGAARWSAADEAVVVSGSIAASRDPRSVGEMLEDVDRLSRRLLFDVTADDAADLLRAWPRFVAASGRVWQALPTRVLPGSGENRADSAAGESGFAMLRIHARTEALAAGLSSPGGQRWPGPGPLHPGLQEIVATLDGAARLVDRWSGDVQLLRPDVRADVDAARARVIHSVWLGAHAGIVALQLRGRELAAGEHGRPVPTSPTRSPFVVAPVVSWVRRLEGCERAASAYLSRAGGYARSASGEARVSEVDPDRLSRALALWDVHAHRVVARHPTAADLTLLARTQADIARLGQVLLSSPSRAAAPDPEGGAARGSAVRGPADAQHALEESHRAWGSVATRWKDLAAPGTPPSMVLLQAAAELRAAISQTTVAAAELAAPGATSVGVIAARAAAELAPEVARHATRLDLTGPARALARRVRDEPDVRQIHDRRGAVEPGHETIWVLPADVAANRLVPLPRPLVDGLRRSSSELVQSTSRAASDVDLAHGRQVYSKEDGMIGPQSLSLGRSNHVEFTARQSSPLGPTR